MTTDDTTSGPDGSPGSDPDAEPVDGAAIGEQQDAVVEERLAEPAGADPAEPPLTSQDASEEPAEAAPVPDEPLLVEPLEPGTPDPSAAVSASPILDPASGQDALEPAPAVPDDVPEQEAPEEPASAEPADLEPAVPMAPEPVEEPAPAEGAPLEPAASEAPSPEPSAEPPAVELAELPHAAADAELPAAELTDEEPPGRLGDDTDHTDHTGDSGDTDDADAAVPAFRSPRALLSALVALVVVLAALTAFLAVRSVSTRGGGGVEEARQEGLAAARSAARVVFSYDYRHLDKDFAAGKALTTGDFAKEYQRTTSRLVDDVAARYKAVVVADISDAAVVSASKDQVLTLVFLNQESTSTLNSGSKITTSRLEMTMVRRGDRWLVSKIRAF